MILTLDVFFLWTWVPLCLLHTCLELQYPLGGFFFWYGILSYLFWLVLAWVVFCQILNGYVAFSLGTFAWNIFFHPFILKWCLALIRLRCVPWIHQKDGSCFLIQSINLCFFIEELCPLVLRIITEQCLLIPVILLWWCGFSSSFDLLVWHYLFLGLL